MSKNSTNAKWQLQRIHQLTAALGMDREAYEEMLVHSYNVKSSRDLTPEQRHQLIGNLTEAATRQGVWHEWNAKKKEYPTSQALKRLRFHTLWCAVRASRLPAFVMQDGRTLEGEKLREWLITEFDAVRQQPQRQARVPIPDSIKRYLSLNFINPLCNKWLGEQDDRRKVRNPAHCYFDQLTPDQVQYLTTRWRQYQRVLQDQSGSVDVPLTYTVPSTIQEN